MTKSYALFWDQKHFHRMAWLGSDLADHDSNPPAMGRDKKDKVSL